MRYLKPLALILATLSFGLSISPAQADEQIDLSVPYSPDPRTTRWWKFDRMVFDENRKYLDIYLKGEHGFPLQIRYTGDPAIDFHRQLNRPNAARSRDRVLFTRLIADGKIPNASGISGSPA